MARGGYSGGSTIIRTGAVDAFRRDTARLKVRATHPDPFTAEGADLLSKFTYKGSRLSKNGKSEQPQKRRLVKAVGNKADIRSERAHVHSTEISDKARKSELNFLALVAAAEVNNSPLPDFATHMGKYFKHETEVLAWINMTPERKSIYSDLVKKRRKRASQSTIDYLARCKQLYNAHLPEGNLPPPPRLLKIEVLRAGGPLAWVLSDPKRSAVVGTRATR
jgi:hypothetical protein